MDNRLLSAPFDPFLSQHSDSSSTEGLQPAVFYLFIEPNLIGVNWWLYQVSHWDQSKEFSQYFNPETWQGRVENLNKFELVEFMTWNRSEIKLFDFIGRGLRLHMAMRSLIVESGVREAAVWIKVSLARLDDSALLGERKWHWDFRSKFLCWTIILQKALKSQFWGF